MRSAIRGVPGIEAPQVLLDQSVARFRIDPKTELQKVTESIQSTHGGMFQAKLLLWPIEGSATPGQMAKARKALSEVKGVASVSEPGKEGEIAIAFTKEGKTSLEDLLKAAADAGVKLGDRRPKT